MKKCLLKLTPFLAFAIFFISSCSTPVDEELDALVEKESKLEDSSSQRTGDFLDYGLHWFASNGSSSKAYNENTNSAISVSTSYYNASKPTVIYFHGWQNGSSQKNYKREDFFLKDPQNGSTINTISKWKQDGWNVAVFYWNQFADESELKDAEAKIWSTSGLRGMRYRLSDGSYSASKSPNTSLGELAFRQFKAVAGNNTSGNIRIVGHSLGNQLATILSKKISDAVQNGQLASRLMPNRLELLDPFWSKGDKSFLGGDWTGERVRNYAREMKNENNLAITWYKSTAILNLGIGDENDGLKDIVALQSERYWYLNTFQIADKHVFVRHDYFWGYSFDAPKEVKLNFWRQRKPTGNVAASASTSTSRIRSMMGDRYVWDQVEGRYTTTPADDQFEIKNW